jgi:hypothetical protein
MALAESWDNLVTAALLGAERGGPSIPLDGELGALLQHAAPPEAPAERRLLAAAAAIDLYRRAGTLLPTGAKAIEPAPAETRPPISRKADIDLRRMLEGTWQEALGEWVAACEKAGRRVRERSLPALLDAAGRHEELRTSIALIMGERGRWLLRHSGTALWRKSFDPPAPDAWDTGTKPERLAFLQHLRREKPAEARQLLETSWAAESPDERAKFLEVLAIGLTMDDEPFLENALDDKRKEVRDAAAELLARLPESRLSLRMFVRASTLISIKKRLLSHPKVDANVPTERTPDMARDGIPEKSNIYGLGEKAFWLSRIVAATPMRFWKETLKLDPMHLVEGSKHSEWHAALMRGLAEAASRQCSNPFARGLLAHWAWELKDREAGEYQETVEMLVRTLPPDEREAALLPYLSGADAFLERELLLTMVRGCRHAWSRDFSEKFTRLLLHTLERENQYYWLKEISSVLAFRVHPDIAPALAARTQGVEKYQSKYLDEFLAIVQFRHDMLKELSQ